MDIKSISLAVAALMLSCGVNAVVLNTLNSVDYEWLELTETVGLSRNQVDVRLADENDILYGYEYASRQLVENLFLSYSSWDGISGWHNESSVVDGVAPFFNDFGITYDNQYGSTSNIIDVHGNGTALNRYQHTAGLYGLTSECTQGNTCYAAIDAYLFNSQYKSIKQVDYFGWQANNANPWLNANDFMNDQAGSFLVRVSTVSETPPPIVPVPAAVWLFASGLLGLIGVARRKSHS